MEAELDEVDLRVCDTCNRAWYTDIGTGSETCPFCETQAAYLRGDAFWRTIARMRAAIPSVETIANIIADALRLPNGNGGAPGKPGDGYDELDEMIAVMVRREVVRALDSVDRD